MRGKLKKEVCEMEVLVAVRAWGMLSMFVQSLKVYCYVVFVIRVKGRGSVVMLVFGCLARGVSAVYVSTSEVCCMSRKKKG